MANTITATSVLEINNNNNEALDMRFKKETLTVGVHNNIFHADEVCAIAVINLYRRELGLASCEVIRSRAQEDWDRCDILVDVGEGAYDHHGVAYSAGQWADDPNIPACGFSKVLEAISKLQYWKSSWWEALADTAKVVSCFDNGKPELLKTGSISPFSWVHGMNTPWNSERPFNAEQMLRFEEAVRLAEVILERLLEVGKAAIAAEEEYENILAAKPASNFGSVHIPEGLPNWQQYVCRNEDAMYCTWEGHDGTWYIWCVPPDVENIFKQRKPMPEAWAALRDTELGVKVLENIPDFDPKSAVFCHKDRFAMGVKSEAAMRQVLAYLAS